MKKRISALLLTVLVIGMTIIPINGGTSATSQLIHTQAVQWPEPSNE